MIDGGTLLLVLGDMASDHEKDVGRDGGTNVLGSCSSFLSLLPVVFVESTMVFSLEMVMQQMSFSIGAGVTVLRFWSIRSRKG